MLLPQNDENEDEDEDDDEDNNNNISLLSLPSLLTSLLSRALWAVVIVLLPPAVVFAFAGVFRTVIVGAKSDEEPNMNSRNEVKEEEDGVADTTPVSREW